MSESSTVEEPRRLADFLREHRNEILESWLAAVKDIRAARGLARPVLLDHMPDFIDELIDYVSELRSGREAAAPRENPRMHALERLGEGYDLAEVVEEYALLRRCIAGLAQRSGAPAVRSVELPLLHRAIDQAITTAAMRYAEARERTLRALDRISSTALEHHDIESLLPKLLDAFLETTASVDSVALSLREDGALRVVAAVGYPAPGPVGSLVPPGAFSARVERQGAMSLHDASADPSVARSPTCAPGTHAMYGTPLMVGSETLGVVVMGSRSTLEFSQEDELLFRTTVNRAAMLIAQARLHAEVERRAAELEAVIESIPEAVLVGDENGFRRANTAALHLTGARKPEEILDPVGPQGTRARWLDGRPVAREEHVFFKALRGEPGSMQVRVPHAQKQSDVVVHVSAAPVLVNGRTVGAVAVDTDITDRIRVEEELRGVLNFRERMLGVLSHDLRNPLQVILASAYSLSHSALDEAQERSVGRVTTSSRRIERMIRDLLDYTRSRRERGLPLSLGEADLAEICRQVIDGLQLLHPERRLRLLIEGNARGTFDADRAAQVVGNLVENAIRYSPAGSDVEVTLRSLDGEVLLEVHNQGEPIAPELLPRIFDAFQRGADDSGREGLGLGLYIVKAIVEAHGGAIEVRSTKSEGTTFSVRWPKS